MHYDIMWNKAESLQPVVLVILW